MPLLHTLALILPNATITHNYPATCTSGLFFCVVSTLLHDLYTGLIVTHGVPMWWVACQLLLLARYTERRQSIKQECGGDANETWAVHGTRSTPPEDVATSHVGICKISSSCGCIVHVTHCANLLLSRLVLFDRHPFYDVYVFLSTKVVAT